MPFLRHIVRTVDGLNEWIGYLVSWLTSILVLVVCYDVVTRYAFNKSSVAVQELEWHLFAAIFLLGAAYCLKHDRHVRVDLIYASLSAKSRAWINLLGSLFFLLPFSVLVIWCSRLFFIDSFEIRETSPNPGGLPARYVLKAVVPVSFVLLLLQGLALAARSLMTILNGETADVAAREGTSVDP